MTFFLWYIRETQFPDQIKRLNRMPLTNRQPWDSQNLRLGVLESRSRCCFEAPAMAVSGMGDGRMPGGDRLFNEAATEEKGERARLSSFVGAMAISDLVKSTLGPKGMDKILQSTSRGGGLMVTNDGATILKALHIDNPAAKVLVGECLSAYLVVVCNLQPPLAVEAG
ncbi:unnamed protein product [Closterium sp. NIES-53]